MLSLITFRRTAEMIAFADSKDKRNKYILYPNYAHIQVKRKERYYNFYLANTAQDTPPVLSTSLLFCHIPELDIIADLQCNRAAFLDFLSISPELKRIIQNSTTKKACLPYVAKLNDITSEKDYDKQRWCLAMELPTIISPQMFVDNTTQFRRVSDAIATLTDAYTLFVDTFEQFATRSTNSPLKKHISAEMASAAIKLVEENDTGPQCMGRNIVDDELKAFVDQHKVVLVGPCGRFSIGNAIPSNATKQAYTLLIKGDVFAPDIPCPWYFSVELKPGNYGPWIPSIFMGEINDRISKILNHTDTKKDGKISPTAFVIMPRTCELWFYSNRQHEDTSLEEFVAEGELRFCKIGNPHPYRIDGQYISVPFWGGPITAENIWQNLSPIATLVKYALTVTGEFLAYAPFYKWEVLNDVSKKFMRGVGYGLNPAKAIADMLRKKKSGDK